MLALAEAFQSAAKKSQASVSKLDEWEAGALGLSLEGYNNWKQGYEETYSAVDETFEKDYTLPKTRRTYTWRDCGNY